MPNDIVSWATTTAGTLKVRALCVAFDTLAPSLSHAHKYAMGSTAPCMAVEVRTLGYKPSVRTFSFRFVMVDLDTGP